MVALYLAKRASQEDPVVLSRSPHEKGYNLCCDQQHDYGQTQPMATSNPMIQVDPPLDYVTDYLESDSRLQFGRPFGGDKHY